MVYQSNREKRIKELEQKHMPEKARTPVYFVYPTDNKAEAIAKHRKQYEMPTDAVLHVVSFIGAA